MHDVSLRYQTRKEQPREYRHGRLRSYPLKMSDLVALRRRLPRHQTQKKVAHEDRPQTLLRCLLFHHRQCLQESQADHVARSPDRYAGMPVMCTPKADLVYPNAPE